MNDHVPTRLPFFVHRCVRRCEAVLDACGVRNEPVVVGVSGGGDSMALLEIVGLLAPRLGLSLHVVCVDHGQRAESAGEAQLVRDAAERWAAVFHCATIHPGATDEDTLRRARHAALEQVRKHSGGRFVLLGHTSDDQIETVVLRFLRGAGLGGLSGMREVRGTLLRPLLGIRRAELRRLLEAREVGWTDDPSNETDRYARGRLRSSVVPAIEAAFGRGVLDHLLDVAPRWRADEDFLEREAARLLAYASRRRSGGVDLDVEALAGAHPALRARVLRRWLLDSTGRTPGSRQVREVERWLESGDGKRGRLDLGGARLDVAGAGLDVAGAGLDVAGAGLARAGGRLSLQLRMENTAATSVGISKADSVDKTETGIDSTASSDDSSEAHLSRDEQQASAVGKGVLPPFHGRVRFPRN